MSFAHQHTEVAIPGIKEAIFLAFGSTADNYKNMKRDIHQLDVCALTLPYEKAEPAAETSQIPLDLSPDYLVQGFRKWH